MSTIYPSQNSGKAEKAHTTQEFIISGRTSEIYDYLRFALVENVNGEELMVHNVLDDYIDLLKSVAVQVHLTPKEVSDYRYNPKKLSHRMYGTTFLYHIILRINDMASTHDFSLANKKIYLIKPNEMRDVVATIYNREKTTIRKYNAKHANDVSIEPIYNDRLSTTK